MFNSRKVRELEGRINELESRLFSLEHKNPKIEVCKSPTLGGGYSAWIANATEIEEINPQYMTYSNAIRYSVPIPYMLNLIIEHLGVDMSLSGKKEGAITLTKKAPVKKQSEKQG